MACNCIKRFGYKLRKQYGDSLYINTGLMQDGTERFDLTAMYRKKKPNGELEKKEREVHLLAEYCPICGKKYLTLDDMGIFTFDTITEMELECVPNKSEDGDPRINIRVKNDNEDLLIVNTGNSFYGKRVAEEIVRRFNNFPVERKDPRPEMAYVIDNFMEQKKVFDNTTMPHSITNLIKKDLSVIISLEKWGHGHYVLDIKFFKEPEDMTQSQIDIIKMLESYLSDKKHDINVFYVMDGFMPEGLLNSFNYKRSYTLYHDINTMGKTIKHTATEQ